MICINKARKGVRDHQRTGTKIEDRLNKSERNITEDLGGDLARAYK